MKYIPKFQNPSSAFKVPTGWLLPKSVALKQTPIPAKPTTKGNFINEFIADHVTPYGYLMSTDDYVAPNEKLNLLSRDYKHKRDNIYNKYNYTPAYGKNKPVEVRNEEDKLKEDYKRKIQQSAYDVNTGKKLYLPNLNGESYIDRSENYVTTGNSVQPHVRPENLNASEDALRLQQGLEQKHSSFYPARYKPSKGNQSDTYYSFSPEIEQEILDDLTRFNNSDFINSEEKFRQVKGSHVAQASLKNFQYSKGEDEQGPYVAYYDINNYGNILDIIPNSKAFEIYGRIYYPRPVKKPMQPTKLNKTIGPSQLKIGGIMKYKKGGSDKNWIQKAVNPAHKGFCTPMTKPTCTPKRKALAKTFKKMAKKEDGGTINYDITNILATWKK